MAQNKPGYHTSQGFAIHSPVLDKWITASTWTSWEKHEHDSLLDKFAVVDLPVQIASIETTARLIRDALPDRIAEELREVGKQLDLNRDWLDKAVTNKYHDYYVQNSREAIKKFERYDQQLRLLLGGPLDIVEITRETNIAHRVLP